MKALFLILFLATNSLYAQDEMSQREKILQEFMESRKAMMDKMLDAFGEDDFFQDDMDDDFFKSIIGDRFQKFQSSKMVSVESLTNNDGSIDVFIRPIDKTVKLDIETKSDAIVVKAKQVEKIENESKSGLSFRSSNQSMTQTVPIPFGYIAKAPREVDGKILISLVKKGRGAVKDLDKVPLPKREGEDTI